MAAIPKPCKEPKNKPPRSAPICMAGIFSLAHLHFYPCFDCGCAEPPKGPWEKGCVPRAWSKMLLVEPCPTEATPRTSLSPRAKLRKLQPKLGRCPDFDPRIAFSCLRKTGWFLGNEKRNDQEKPSPCGFPLWLPSRESPSPVHSDSVPSGFINLGKERPCDLLLSALLSVCLTEGAGKQPATKHAPSVHSFSGQAS